MTQRPTAIGFATKNVAVIVHTCVLDELPGPFKEILSDEKLTKVGAAVAADCAKIERHFDAEVKPTACVPAMAKRELCAEGLSTTTNAWGLTDVADTILGKKVGLNDNSPRTGLRFTD